MKKILITGCNGELGVALCNKFLKDGYYVIGTDKQKNKLTKLNLYIQLDFKSALIESNYEKLLKQKFNEKKIKNIDVLINNAALQIVKSVDETSVSDFQKTLSVNLITPFLLTKIFKKRLEASKGFIVNIGSIHNKLTLPNFISYAASKSAFSSISRSLAIEYGSSVKVIEVNPAAMDTKMLKKGLSKNEYKAIRKLNPCSEIIKTNDFANFISILINSTNFQSINGSSINIDGGISYLLKN
jgi:NAD(P)-dependent dehydrogenase (short-subunit alcohol dehydrogenase family)